ncbi:hypothetical protein BpHYR1_024968 [Brachionus plicatilis]|uniref:Uncharacterized protein n=1 Tax=Brachionus plicatilis TaxID=10195 RepID=A0A3M7S9N7_BRAPC|nr:hypothetical protein BpHYR1_024968 [Brachionus plicatilis]
MESRAQHILIQNPLLYSSTSLTTNETERFSHIATYLLVNSKSRFETLNSELQRCFISSTIEIVAEEMNKKIVASKDLRQHAHFVLSRQLSIQLHPSINVGSVFKGTPSRGILLAE